MSRAIPAEYAEAGSVKPGDDIVFLGAPHRIVTVEAYTHPDGWHGEVATDAYGWAIVLPPHSRRCLFPAKPEQLALPA